MNSSMEIRKNNHPMMVAIPPPVIIGLPFLVFR